MQPHIQIPLPRLFQHSAMLNCRACMRRCTYRLIGEPFRQMRFIVTDIRDGNIPRPARIQFQASGTERRFSGDDDPKPFLSKDINASNKDADERLVWSRQQWLESRGKRPATSKNPKAENMPTKAKRAPWSQRDIRKNLEFLQDPLKLADQTRQYLRDGRYELAHQLVVQASKDNLVTVSWNHLIDWQLSKGMVKAAISTYNDMKKRAQIPDAHTFTILFRGMANVQERTTGHDGTLAKALSIYHSMSAPNSPVKPNTIHTNAVMKVCARAGDLDAMMGIAARLSQSGLGAPNNLTFTTIFNAMRILASGAPNGDGLISLRSKTIADARRIWADIVSRWRRGDLLIDEELTCSMGRILLMGEPSDIDDVFSLVGQTMNVPRMVPRYGSRARDRIEPSRQGQKKPMDPVLELPAVPSDDAPVDGVDNLPGLAEIPKAQLEKVSVFTSTQFSNQGGYAVAGRNTLALILEALFILNMKEPMVAYWKYFTEEKNIQPDSQNYHTYLRVLRWARSSSDTVAFLQTMPKHMLEKKTFRIAMSTCLRDKNNPKAFANAGQILHLMESTQARLDIVALHAYLDTAVSNAMQRAHNEVKHSGRGEIEAKFAQGRQIRRALDRLGPATFNIRAILFHPLHDAAPVSYTVLESRERYRAAAVALMCEMISAYDQLMNKGMVPREDYGVLTEQRSKISAYITRASARSPRKTHFGKPSGLDDGQEELDKAADASLAHTPNGVIIKEPKHIGFRKRDERGRFIWRGSTV